MRGLVLISAFVISATAVVARAAPPQAHPTPFEDAAKGYKTMIPEQWSTPGADMVTVSADQTVRCTFLVTPDASTIGMTQPDINASMAKYTADIWAQRYFTGGVTGKIEVSGITQLEGFDAPWARGTIIYPGREPLRFNVLVVGGPGKLVTGTCMGDAVNFVDKFGEIGIVLNYLRPL